MDGVKWWASMDPMTHWVTILVSYLPWTSTAFPLLWSNGSTQSLWLWIDQESSYRSKVDWYWPRHCGGSTIRYVLITHWVIGHLLEYEYFLIDANPEHGNKTVRKGIVFSKEPPVDIINFLRNYNFNVYWRSSGRIEGDPESKNILDSFLKTQGNN